MSEPCLLIVAVEPSGDELAASLARAVKARLEGRIRLIGVGGPALAHEGLQSLFDPSPLALVGVFNALRAWPLARARVKDVAALAARERPDAAVLVDSWGFSIRLAKGLRRVRPHLPLIKYVAPQVWATRPGRARTLARRVDRLMTIHSFDAPYFEREGLKTHFVGNPTLVRDFSKSDPAALRRKLEVAPNSPLLLILPGSREGEVRRLMDPFGDAAHRLSEGRPDLRVIIAAAPAVAQDVRARAANWRISPLILDSEEDRLSAMQAATAALACSGTVTTELAMAGCPMVVAYRLDVLTHAAAKILLRTPYVTLFNVAAGRLVAVERIQGQCRGDILAHDLAKLLDDPASRSAQVAAQGAALKVMRGGLADPISAAADVVLAVLEGAKP